jgi:uncharacterized protein (TIRG00374 family)
MDMRQSHKITVSLLIGIVFSGAAIYVSFRNVPLSQLFEYMKNIDLWWAVFSVLVGLASYLLRALRWQIILMPVKKIGFWHTFHPLSIAFMINCILPGRMGELARPAILYKRDQVAFSKGLATVGVERIFDLVALLFLFIVIMGSIEINPRLSLDFNGYLINRSMLQTIWSGMLKAGIVLIGLIVLLMLPAVRKAISSLMYWVPYPLFFTSARYRQDLGMKLHETSRTVLDNIALGFEVLKSPVKIIACLILSLATWLMIFCSFYVLTLGCSGVAVTFLQASAVTMFICFFIMLPSVPGYWGIWEIGGIYGLMLFGVPKIQAAGATLAFHAFQIFPIIFIGMFSAWVTGVNILQAGLHSREGIPEDENLNQTSR